jgi:hypothetical protein
VIAPTLLIEESLQFLRLKSNSKALISSAKNYFGKFFPRALSNDLMGIDMVCINSSVTRDVSERAQNVTKITQY